MPTTNLLRLAICAAIAVVALLAPSGAEARIGTLDPSFGEGGRVVLTALGAPFRMDVGPDGSVTILSNEGFSSFPAGGILSNDSVNRFLPDGRPDPGFGERGRATLSPLIEGLPFAPSSIAVDNQGRVLVFGTASDPTQSQGIASGFGIESVPESWAVVLRLSADGILDTSFGEGSGFVRSDFGLLSSMSELPSNFPTVATLDGSVDSQDRPVLLVEVSEQSPACFAKGGVEMVPRAIVRLTAPGSLDPSFAGADGISPMEGSLAARRASVRIIAGDQPFALVETANCLGSVAFHLSADGSPLLGLGANGLLFPGLESGVIDSSGALLLHVGRPTREVVQIGPDGSRDERFGKDGSGGVTMPAGVQRTLRPVGIDAQGRIVLVGSFVLPPKLHGANADAKQQGPRRGYFLAMRLLPSGKPDLSFGNHGRIAMPVGENRRVSVGQAALDSQGRLLALLSVRAGRTVVERVLVRYLLEG